jgi:hypothetical protein
MEVDAPWAPHRLRRPQLNPKPPLPLQRLKE